MDIQFIDSGDWEALRLTPYTYWPPKPSTEPLRYGGAIAPPPRPIILPGPEGIIWGDGCNRNGKRALMVQIGLREPFQPEVLKYMKNSGQWNPNFNLWQIPIKSQTVRAAIKEMLGISQEMLLDFCWGWRIEALLRWGGLTEKESAIFHRFITAMNRFWVTGEVQFIATENIPVQLMSLEELREKVRRHCLDRKVTPSASKQNCVNFLRHQCTTYEARLKLKPNFATEEQSKNWQSQLFEEVNGAIAKAYPSFEKEAMKQISWRKKTLFH